MPKIKIDDDQIQLALIRTTIAANVTNRMNYLYRKLPNETTRYRAVCKKAIPQKIGKTTIKRICNTSETSWPKIDKLIAIAKGLELSPYQLFIPSLDPKNPQVAISPGAGEYALYGRIGVPERDDDGDPETV